MVPGAPTLNKTIPGFTSEVWFGLLAPAGTPDDVIQKLNTATKKVMADSAIRARVSSPRRPAPDHDACGVRLRDEP